MPGNDTPKPARGKERKAARTLRPARQNRPIVEELSPERRVELARQAEAKRLRGKPPSI